MFGLFSFALTIFLSAFLLFQIEPLISRYILPWFGGTPAVWSTSMLFFQVFLLAGYAYADWLASRIRKQLLLHIILLTVSMLVLIACALRWGVPLLPDSSWQPPDASLPVARILIVLTVSIGLPFFILSTTSPLLQSWFKSLYPNRVPYQLYALSNFGSLLALVSYPVVFEPLLSLREQSRIWSITYAIYIGLCIYLAVRMLSRERVEIPPVTSGSIEHTNQPIDAVINLPDLINEEGSRLAGPTVKSPPTLFRRLLWVALPACSSILLLSITNQLTQEVAVIPFLWIVPLSIYLFSFTIAFSGEKWYRQVVSLICLAISTGLLCYALARVATIGVFPQIAIYSFFLLMATLVCHGEIYRLRPDPGQLTSFYLFVSLGGAIGALFVNLAAPLLFRGFWELQLGVLFCWLMVLLLLIYNRRSLFHRRWIWIAAPLVILTIGGTSIFFYRQIKGTLDGVLEMQRNFYGVFRVRRISAGEPPHDALSLNHGLTAHGFQYVDAERKKIPTTYYGRKSGIGLAIANYAFSLGKDPTSQRLRVGVIGLGTGTLAVYGKKGDYYRFYEINPDIIELARGKGGYFTYLEDSQATVEIVAGDARVSLEQELERGEPGEFDILAVDAFSSDSIPVHLLTAEVFSIYLRHLKPEGVLALHISNRYLDLEPLAYALATLYHLDHALIASPRNDDGSYAAVWVLLSKNKAFFTLPEILLNMKPPGAEGSAVRVWTDDYSNLFQFVRKDVLFQTH